MEKIVTSINDLSPHEQKTLIHIATLTGDGFDSGEQAIANDLVEYGLLRTLPGDFKRPTPQGAKLVIEIILARMIESWE